MDVIEITSETTYSVFGSLPAGLAFNTSTRVISGTPAEVGSGTITIRARNSAGSDDWTVDYSFVAGVLTIGAFQLPVGETSLVLALFEAGGSATLYDGRTGFESGSLIEGDIEVDGLTVNRIREVDTNILLLNRSGTGNFSTLFSDSGTYPLSSFYIQTLDGLATYTLPAELDSVFTGSIRLDGDADDDEILAGIEDGDRFILAITSRSDVVELETTISPDEPEFAADLAVEVTASIKDLESSISSGTPTFSADLDISFSTETLELSVEIESGTPTFTANLGDVSNEHELEVEVASGTPTATGSLDVYSGDIFIRTNINAAAPEFSSDLTVEEAIVVRENTQIPTGSFKGSN